MTNFEDGVLNYFLYRNSKYEKREYCRRIIDKMFQTEANDENESDIEYYLNAYIALNNYVKEKQIKELFTFNDFKKFLFFLQNSRIDEGESKQIFEIQTLTQLLLVYKFKSKEEIRNANEILRNSLASDFWPIFSYLSDEEDLKEDDNDEFRIDPYNKEQNLCYKTKQQLKKEEKKNLLSKIHSLSPDQRRGIIFLMLSVLSDVPCVVQGVTASGKTHLVRLFCQLLGQIPLIIDINNDTGISILLKQLVPKEDLEKRKIKEIKEAIKLLKKKEKKVFENEIDKIIDIENGSSWLPSHFKNLLKLLEEKTSEIDNKNLFLISNLKMLLNEQLSFFKHLPNEDSAFIKAMLNGNWVILDGIESAQPELYQRISSLCDLENQNLTMYDNGPEYVYKKNSENKKLRIHPDFRLFITYNPFEVEPSKKLPQSFLNKCLTFSLGSIDENIKTTSLVLSGTFIDYKLYRNIEKEYVEKNIEKLKEELEQMSGKKKKLINNLLKEDLRSLAIRFANIHHYANKLVFEKKENFAGKKSFSGRSIKFILNILKSKPNDILEGIISVIQDIYCYPYKQSQTEFKADLIKHFIDSPIDENMQFLRNDEDIVDEKYKAITKTLINIGKNPTISLDMDQFIISTYAYIYKDIPHLIKELDNCISLIDINKMY